MEDKTLHTLEYQRILERLASFAAFPASAEKARLLRPVNDISEARRLLAETREAVQLLDSQSNLSIGGARDVRAAVGLASRSGVLDPNQLLDIKFTLISARTLKRTFERLGDLYPHLGEIVARIPPPLGLIDAISHALSDRGDILDTASDKLRNIRRELRIVYERLMGKLQHMVGDPKNTPFLQDTLITQREGRYVLPLRAEFKGRIKAIVHDQSASGATLFIEPLAVVELNNQFKELQLAERDEERRILAELSDQVGLHSGEILQTVEVIAMLDLALARAKYSEKMHGSEPTLHPIRHTEGSRHPGSVIRLYQARHPLLDPQSVVPIDVELDEGTYALIITGPNTGGKTVTLKTVGLLVLMAQSGLLIPALPGSELSFFENVYADIGDEQSIEQSLSTFSGHINNIIHILEEADRRSLVVIDELGAGTDPQEGAALARAILTHLLERSITTLVTTHHPELKAFAHAAPGVVNASVEFDLETLQPTYHLTIGLPGRSNALAIAQRLGMPESIIAKAREELKPEDLRAEDLLDEIHRQREAAQQARQAAEAIRQESAGLLAELRQRLDRIEDERQAVLEETHREVESQIQELQKEIDEIRRSLANLRQPSETLESIEEKIEALEEKAEEIIEKQVVQPRAFGKEAGPGEDRPLRPGDRVRLRRLNSQGILTSLGEEEAEVQMGNLRVKARLSDLVRAEPRLESAIPGKPRRRARQRTSPSDQTMQAGNLASSANLPPSPGLELDLRGQRAEDALDALERYLDAAYLAGMPFVRIIHGKGTGRLREVVRQSLSQQANVSSYEAGQEKEGGDGVTVVKLKTS